MSKSNINLFRLFNPATDIPALLTIGLGLGIALLIGDLAVRLIGVCIAVLGGVAVFVLLSQRLKDVSVMSNREKSVSEVTAFKTTIKQEQSGKRLVFDDFAESFGTSDFEQAATEQKHNTTSQSPSAESPQASLETTSLSTNSARSAGKFVFGDDIDDDDGFSFAGGSLPELKLNPDAYIPTPRKPSEEGSEGEEFTGASFQNPASQQPSKARLSFDDTDEMRGATMRGESDLTFVVPMEQSEPKPTINPVHPMAQRLQEAQANKPPDTPIPTPTFDAETFGDGDFGDEGGIRIVGKRTSEIPHPPPVKVPSGELQGLRDEEPSAKNQEQAEQIFERVRMAEAPRIDQLTPKTLVIPQTPIELGSATKHGQDILVGDDSKIQHASAQEQPKQETKRKKLSIQRTELVDEVPDIAKQEPRKEFDYLLQRVLLVIRSVINARTAAFMWSHFDRKQFITEARISDAQEALQKSNVLPINEASQQQDVLSQIATSGTPEILTDINPDAELQLLPYYAEVAGTRSFVGVPVFFNNIVVGVLMADSTEDDAYDSVTVSFLGHFTKLISGLIQGYNEKYDLLQSARMLEAIETFRSLTIKYDNSPEDICTATVESVSRLIPYNAVGAVMFSEKQGQWYICDVRSKEAFDITGGEVHLDNSLVGKVITGGKTMQFPSTAGKIRVTPLEPKRNNVVLTAVPFVSTTRCYGALFVEELGDAQLTKQDIELLQTTAEYAGSALEQMQLKDFLHQHTLVDDATEILNKAGFLQRTHEEFIRASDVQLAFAVVLIGIDQYASFNKQNNAHFTESMIMHIAQIVRRNVRVYDIVGRYSDNIIAVGLVEKNTQDTQIWAERVRRDVASTMFTVEGKQYAVTVSAGIVEYLKQKSLAELVLNVETAYALARDKTNTVSIFS